MIKRIAIGLVIVAGAIGLLKMPSGSPMAGATVLLEYQGGTSESVYRKGDMLYASATNTLDKLASGSAGQCLTMSAGKPTWGSCSGAVAQATIGVRTNNSTFNATSSISFDKYHFASLFSSPETTLNLASNSIDFNQLKAAMTLDTNTTITGGAFALTFDHASASGPFEVSANASISSGWVNNYVDFRGLSANPTAPAAGIARFHAFTTQGFTRFEQDNEAATNLVLGRDSAFIAKNTTVSTITKGQVVYVTGATGNVPNIGLAKGNSLTTLPNIGIALDSINSNSFGQVMVIGLLTNFDTSAFTAGDQLYVSPTTAGALTNVRPAYPNYVAKVGEVTTSGVSGEIFIDIAPFIGMNESGTNQTAYTFGGSATVSNNFEIRGTIASMSANLLVNGTGSSSFAGSLNVTKSITGGGLTVSGINDTGQIIVSGTASNSFLGSLNISKSLTVTKTITEQGTGSSSFAGSLDVAKGIKGLSFQGGGLTTCTGTSFLQYTQGQFSCAAAPGGISAQAGVAATELTFFQSASVVSGSAKLQWDSVNKRLGIGKATPLTTLDITGSASVSTDFEFDGKASGSRLLIGDGSNPATSVGHNAAERIHIYTPSSEVARLVVESGGTFMSFGADNSNGPFFGWNYLQSMRFAALSSASGGGNPVFTEKMRIDTNGNLGVGTTVPTAKLSINGTASISGSFTQTSVASNSFNGSLSGPTTGTLSVGTSNNPLKILWSNIVRIVNSLFVPSSANPTVSSTGGNLAVDTASESLSFYGGSVAKSIHNICKTFTVDAPTASNPSQVGPVRFNDPFTITSVQSVASGSNSASWNLVYGAPGSLTTSVFTLDKKASTSSYPTYTSFANSTITDGQGLAVKITSKSAVLQTFSVSVCGYYPDQP